jgi:ubiquinol-cytochrome c reductase cytochrome b subunit/menaquinol-cytochrome c reductase cytochrome b/c subunit
VNQAEKEAYLREYSLLKNEGKPFFPYAVAKDSIMSLIVILVIIFLTLMFGAELGPKANPTTTTYVPRPDWYFFFLFEVLRVIKPPVWVQFATIGVPTVCMILLFLLPFYDRSPERRIERRPVALTAGVLTIAAMAFLTYSGADAGSINEVTMKPPSNLTPAQAATFRAGEEVVGQSGCLACHRIGADGAAGGLGPNLDDVGTFLKPDAIASTLENPTPPMPSFRGIAQQYPNKFKDLVAFLSDLQG